MKASWSPGACAALVWPDSIRVVDAAAGYAADEAAERVVASLKAHRWQGFEGAALLNQPATDVSR